MSQQPSPPMPWWQIIAILVGVAVVVGLAIGVLGTAFDFATGWSGPAIGAAVGIVAALLVSRRRRAMED
jgi:membrane associated rhomboid family serine protease